MRIDIITVLPEMCLIFKEREESNRKKVVPLLDTEGSTSTPFS